MTKAVGASNPRHSQSADLIVLSLACVGEVLMLADSTSGLPPAATSPTPEVCDVTRGAGVLTATLSFAKRDLDAPRDTARPRLLAVGDRLDLDVGGRGGARVVSRFGMRVRDRSARASAVRVGGFIPLQKCRQQASGTASKRTSNTTTSSRAVGVASTPCWTGRPAAASG